MRRGSPPHPSTPRLPPLLLRPQLQEQLQRLLLVNAELRHKLAAVEAQLRAARDRESERELPRQGVVELARDQAGGAGYEQRQEPERAAADAGAPGTPEDPVRAHHSTHRSGACWALAEGLLCCAAGPPGRGEAAHSARPWPAPAPTLSRALICHLLQRPQLPSLAACHLP